MPGIDRDTSRRAQFIEGINTSNRWLPFGNVAYLRIHGLRNMQWSCYRKAEKGKGSRPLWYLFAGGLQYMQTAGIAKVIDDAFRTHGVIIPPAVLSAYRIAPLLIAFLPKRWALVREHYSDLGSAIQVVAGAFLWRKGQRAYAAGVIFGAGLTLATTSTRIFTQYQPNFQHHGHRIRLFLSAINKGVIPVIDHWESLSNWRNDTAPAAKSAAAVTCKVGTSLLKSLLVKTGMAYAAGL